MIIDASVVLKGFFPNAVRDRLPGVIWIEDYLPE
jgi:hypothetical protein